MRWWRWLLIAGLFLAWLSTGLTEIGPGERAVVRRFGRVLDVDPRAGLWISFPWGIDRVDKEPVEKMRRVSVGHFPGTDPTTEDTPPGQLLTGDNNLVNVRVVVNYTVDPEAVVDFVVQGEQVEELLSRSAETALADWMAGRPVDEVLLRGKTTLPRELIERLEPRLRELRLGVRLRSIDVAHLAPPDDVKHAFDRVAQAEARREGQKNQARREAEQEENRVGIRINEMNHQAKAYAEVRPAQARDEAAGFEARLRTYRANPLVREIGRLSHLVRMVSRLVENEQLTPLDPNIDVPKP